MIFKDPIFFALVPVVAAVIFFRKKRVRSASIRFSNTGLFENPRPNIRILIADNLWYLLIIALLCLIVALARPRVLLEDAVVYTEGIDMVLAIDSSGSMLAEDFKISNKRQNRLFVVKDVVENFIRNRPGDRIGLVTFAGMAYTVCPMTLDHDWLIANLRRISIGAIEDGTAIGSGIMSSLSRLGKSSAKSKIIILLTDGENNSGNISPIQSANTAKAFGVKIYTIGFGSNGPVPFPARDLWGNIVYQNVDIGFDEDLLRKIAEATGGQYFMASDTESLRAIYGHIDKLEKAKIEDAGYRRYKELFPPFVVASMIMILLHAILSNTMFRKVP
ncbi:MAG: VWA domain-containing protein [Candidatus Omnitrophica bacterium]|jgi:Ca-activated chloride channel family protein|nr:VWA domain-containing protein [Candidatus Omnitrophota bacterium]